MEMMMVMNKPLRPFKFNSSSFDDGEYKNMIKILLIPFDSSIIEYANIQFLNNLKKIKAWSIRLGNRERKNN